MKRSSKCLVVTVLCCLASWNACAHFQVLIPSNDVVGQSDPKTITLNLVFTHPMEQGPAMEMGEPRQFGVLVNGAKADLKSSLRRVEVDGKTAYTCTYTVKAPGSHIFYVEPAPYWEQAEQKMIIHFTKVVVDAFDSGEGWDALVGFPVEIEPLVRPYGLWTGNVFQGIVRRNGAPVPFATVEVEYLNQNHVVTPPKDAFVTQVIKADANGVFTYAMPRAGWWGFAALVDGDEQMESPDGQKVDVELGGLIWVKTVDMK
jgi:cobalt/nickel transport protein